MMAERGTLQLDPWLAHAGDVALIGGRLVA